MIATMNAKGVLAVSLALNLGLLGAVGWLVKSRCCSSSATGNQPLQTNLKTNFTVQPAAQPTPPATGESAEPVKPTKSFDWRMVESEDYKKYIANLRSIGCPEETIRDIIVADVAKLFDSRLR